MADTKEKMFERTRLLLVRHGNTADEETGRIYKGSLDIPLSGEGRDRMRKAAGFLSAFTIDKVYTSTLSRSVESGRIVAGPHGLDIEMAPAFNEVSFGDWEGLNFDQIRQQYRNEQELWLEDPGNHPPPGGESFYDAQVRGMDRLRAVIDEHRGQTIALVGHGGMLRIMIFSLLDLKLTQLFRFAQDYGAINIVDLYGDIHPILSLLNYTQY
jgi:broad specificity phosphatase PhoE